MGNNNNNNNNNNNSNNNRDNNNPILNTILNGNSTSNTSTPINSHKRNYNGSPIRQSSQVIKINGNVLSNPTINRINSNGNFNNNNNNNNNNSSPINGFGRNTPPMPLFNSNNSNNNNNNNNNSNSNNSNNNNNNHSHSDALKAFKEKSAGIHGQFCCKHCQITFPDNILFGLHMGQHCVSDPFKCNICGYACEDRYDFMVHFAMGKHLQK